MVRRRLPTESEWEYVATNNGTTLYPWGNNTNSNINCDYSYICDVNEFTIEKKNMCKTNDWKYTGMVSRTDISA